MNAFGTDMYDLISGKMLTNPSDDFEPGDPEYIKEKPEKALKVKKAAKIEKKRIVKVRVGLEETVEEELIDMTEGTVEEVKANGMEEKLMEMEAVEEAKSTKEKEQKGVVADSSGDVDKGTKDGEVSGAVEGTQKRGKNVKELQQVVSPPSDHFLPGERELSPDEETRAAEELVGRRECNVLGECKLSP